LKNQHIRIGTRGSDLALWQTNWVKEELLKKFPELQVDITIIKTTGDKILDSPLSNIGDKGLFIKEIEQALLNGEIDLAVHSLKDVPTLIPNGLTIGAITRREDVRDVFIAHPKKPYKKFRDIPQGGTIATGSLRRKSQVLRMRPDVQIVDVRGNLNTRFRKLEESSWDGMILARAGVVRLGWESRITEVLPTVEILPAVGQGALAIEIRAGDKRLGKLCASLHHDPTSKAALCERALLRRLEGGCQIPVGAYARTEDGQFMMEGLVGSADGRYAVRGTIRGSADDAETLGRDLAETLLEGGAREILVSIRASQESSTYFE
jgi:hydroxymethylbilane synthase